MYMFEVVVKMKQVGNSKGTFFLASPLESHL